MNKFPISVFQKPKKLNSNWYHRRSVIVGSFFEIFNRIFMLLTLAFFEPPFNLVAWHFHRLSHEKKD